jgi:hypothetical protein
MRKDEQRKLLTLTNRLLREFNLIRIRRRPRLVAREDAVDRFRCGIMTLLTAPEQKQHRWSKKQAIAGQCRICGQRRHLYGSYCDACAARRREQARLRWGHHPWQPGKPGRPPQSERFLDPERVAEIWEKFLQLTHR